MDVFKDLYQQLIIDHSQNPRNFRKLENFNNRQIHHEKIIFEKFCCKSI